MKSRLPWILFFLSLTLNIAVIVGFLYMQHLRSGGQGEELMERVRGELALSKQQYDNLVGLRDSIGERIQSMERTTGSWNDFVLEVLSAPAYDAEVVRIALIERSQPNRDFVIAAMSDLHAFVLTLDDKQRSAFLAKAAEDPDFLRQLLVPPPPKKKPQ